MSNIRSWMVLGALLWPCAYSLKCFTQGGVQNPEVEGIYTTYDWVLSPVARASECPGECYTAQVKKRARFTVLDVNTNAEWEGPYAGCGCAEAGSLFGSDAFNSTVLGAFMRNADEVVYTELLEATVSNVRCCSGSDFCNNFIPGTFRTFIGAASTTASLLAIFLAASSCLLLPLLL